MFEQNQITFRKAELSDAQILAEYRVCFLNELFPDKTKNESKKLKTELMEYFTESLSENLVISWLAEIDKKVVGTSTLVIWKAPLSYSGLGKSGKRGYILNMYTLKEHRNKGIASVLLDKLLQEAKRLNLEYVHLHATDDGINIYKRIGFKEPFYPELKLEVK